MLTLKDHTLLKQQCYLNGEWRHASSGKTIAVTNPATGEVISWVPDMDAKDAEEAIIAAEQASNSWKSTPAKQRAQLLQQWFQLIIEHQEDLAIILTAEQGKPLLEAKGEINYGASYIEWYAEEAKRVYGDTIPSANNDTRILVLRQPVGVTAAITPWNFPNAMVTRKAAAALAAGCPLVLRPASYTPLSALAIAELAHRAGIPAGVLSIITGNSSRLGAVLTGSKQVRKFSFTGSTEVGRQLLGQCAPTIKKVSLELGGNAPFIIFNDADLEAAIEGLMLAKFRNTGQTCICANRIYVQTDIYHTFVDRFAHAMAQLKVGNGLEVGVNQGPLIDEKAVVKVEQHIADALAKGASLVCGGKRHALGGNFFEPTLLSQVTHSMQVAQQETFGPLAPIFQFDTEQEVINCANNTEFGLASYFYTRDIGRIFRVAEALEYGMVAVNTGVLSSNAATPFGGIKQSGIGREGSRYGLDDYLELKYLCLAGIEH